MCGDVPSATCDEGYEGRMRTVLRGHREWCTATRETVAEVEVALEGTGLYLLNNQDLVPMAMYAINASICSGIEHMEEVAEVSEIRIGRTLTALLRMSLFSFGQ